MCFSRAQQLLLFYSLTLGPSMCNTKHGLFLRVERHRGRRKNNIYISTTHLQAPKHIHYLFSLLIFMILEHLLPKLSSISFHAFLFVYFCFNIMLYYAIADVFSRMIERKREENNHTEKVFIAKILQRKLLYAITISFKM